MRLAGGVGKGAGHQQQIHTARGIAPVQLGKAQVVAHAHAHLPGVAVLGRQRKLLRQRTGLQNARLVIGLAPVIKAKQVHLVVARHAGALRIKGQAAVEHARGLAAGRCVVGRERQGARHNPQPQAVRLFGHKVLDRPCAKALLDGEFVVVLAADQAKVFGQDRQLGPGVGSLLQQHAGLRQVVGQRLGGHHLQGSDEHRAGLQKNGWAERALGPIAWSASGGPPWSRAAPAKYRQCTTPGCWRRSAAGAAAVGPRRNTGPPAG